jgi:hypothetical protein
MAVPTGLIVCDGIFAAFIGSIMAGGGFVEHLLNEKFVKSAKALTEKGRTGALSLPT